MTSRPFARLACLAPLAAMLLMLAARCAFADGNPIPDPPLPYIQNVTIGRAPCDTCAPIVCAGEPVQVTVSGQLPPCVEFRGLHEGRGLFTQVVVAEFVVDTCRANCPQLVAPFTGGTSLPPQLAGRYGLTVFVRVRACPDTSVVADSSDATFGYSVIDCPTAPIPPDSLVRTFVKLATVPEHPCAGDAVTLQLRTNGCPPCVNLVSFGDSASGHGHFEGVIEWTPNCLNLACLPETLSASMGRLAAGSYRIFAPMTVHVLGTANPDSTLGFTIPFEFQVGVGCGGPPPLCVVREMESTVPAHQCALTIAPGDTGSVPLLYSSDLPMAGVQGVLHIPVPFRLTDLHLAAGVTGAHLSMLRLVDGIHWLVFTDNGVTLAPGVRQHLLDATITADRNAPRGFSQLMTAAITLASDADGNELPLCNRPTLEVVAIRLCVGLAEHPACDVNHDGRLDVRDLVRLVGCLRLDLVDTSRTCVDCDSSGAFDIADIFCCAQNILRGPLVPRDSVHQEANVAVSLGPIWSAGASRIVHVRVTGAQTLGAALVRLDYPADRWRASVRVVLDQTTRPVDADWYPLMDLDDPGHVHLGALRLGDTGQDAFEFELVMESIVTPLASDRLDVVGADLAARDGAVLTPRDPLPGLNLTAPAPPEPGPGPFLGPLALSPPRPNPFSTRTSFDVTLPQVATVDLAVHDLAGRRIATLASGAYTAGRHTFDWDGAGARGGMYYVRLTVNGEVRSTRVAFLRNSH